MSRLPIPGQDNGNWGEILNDFLEQAHNEDGTLKESAISSKEDVSNKSINVTTDATSDDKYPSVKAAKTYTDDKISEVNAQLTDAFDMDNMTQGNTNKYVTAADLTNLSNLSGINTGDQDLSGFVTKATLTTKGDLYAASAASTPARLAIGTDGQILTADSSETTGMKWASSGLSNRNILHNWDFRNPVNQRGESSYSGAEQYTIDRWKAGSSAATITKNAESITLACSLAYVLTWYQAIENPTLYLGKILTLSLEVDGVIESGTVTVPASGAFDLNAFTMGNGEYYVNLYGDGSSYMYFRIVSLTTSASVVLTRAKLEMGTVSTLANDPPADYGEQLTLCQRFFLHNAGRFAVGYTLANSPNCVLMVSTPVTMRTTPTVTYKGNNGYIIKASGNEPCTGAYVSSLESNGVLVVMTVGVTLTGFELCSSDGGTILDLSADL